jgi:predicted O-methyltransferase YrrM
MHWALKKAANISPVRLWQWVTNPGLEWAKTSAPPSISSTEAVTVLFPEVCRNDVEKYSSEFLNNSRLFLELNKGMVEKRRRWISPIDWTEFLYVATRIIRPQVMIETGVFDGMSSSVILQAMEDNGSGSLVSIDLPATNTILGSTQRMRETTLPRGCQPGWIVPEYLGSRYRLVLGDSKVLLPQLLREYPTIDVFFHDSLHTFDHQYYEYATAWSHVREGGLLLSDDIFWSHAFHKFCKEHGKGYLHIGEFGAIRK